MPKFYSQKWQKFKIKDGEKGPVVWEVKLLALGLPQAIYYFLPGENERPRAVLVENLLLLSFMGGLFSLFLLGGNRFLAWRFNNPDIAKTLRILVPYPLFMLPASALSDGLVREYIPGKNMKHWFVKPRHRLGLSRPSRRRVTFSQVFILERLSPCRPSK